MHFGASSLSNRASGSLEFDLFTICVCSAASWVVEKSESGVERVSGSAGIERTHIDKKGERVDSKSSWILVFFWSATTEHRWFVVSRTIASVQKIVQSVLISHRVHACVCVNVLVCVGTCFNCLK